MNARDDAELFWRQLASLVAQAPRRADQFERLMGLYSGRFPDDGPKEREAAAARIQRMLAA